MGKVIDFFTRQVIFDKNRDTNRKPHNKTNKNRSMYLNETLLFLRNSLVFLNTARYNNLSELSGLIDTVSSYIKYLEELEINEKEQKEGVNQ